MRVARLFLSVLLGSLSLSALRAEDAKPAEPAPAAKPAEAKPTFQLTDDEKKAGWKVLFDGTSTENFRGYKQKAMPAKGWVIEDGNLKHLPNGGGGDLITIEQFKDFELSLEWKVTPGANSGVMFRVSETAGPSYMTGPEMQILDDEKHPDGKNPKTSASALYALIPCSKDKELKPVGEWNQVRLILQGGKGEHWLNGKKVVEYDLASEDVKKLIAGSKFKDWKGFAQNTQGHLALQDHGNETYFRNIKIRVITPADPVTAAPAAAPATK